MSSACFYLHFTYQFQAERGYHQARSLMNTSSSLKMPFPTINTDFRVVSHSLMKPWAISLTIWFNLHLKNKGDTIYLIRVL